MRRFPLRPFATRSSLVAALLATACLGCGSSEKLPEPVAVSGQITSSSKPLADVTVGFMAISKGLPANVRYVHATTDAEGKYSIAEVYPAEYQVTLMPASAAKTEVDPNNAAANPANPEFAKFGPESPLRANVSATQTKFDFDTKAK